MKRNRVQKYRKSQVYIKTIWCKHQDWWRVAFQQVAAIFTEGTTADVLKGVLIRWNWQCGSVAERKERAKGLSDGQRIGIMTHDCHDHATGICVILCL